jgi:hypothetical protein
MLNILKRNKKIIAVFILVLILSFGLRFLKVLYEKQPIFGDEAIYVRWSQVMQAEPSLRFVPQTDGKQPLFMWATIPFLKIFDDPLIAGRMLSVYTGVVATAGVFFLTLLLFESKKLAIIAGIIYAISPFAVFFDSMALTDSMLSMFGIWTLIFAVITVKKLRLDTAMLSGFALGGALLTKTPATFFAILLPLTLIIHKWPQKLKNKLKRFAVFIFLFTPAYFIAYGMYNILRLGPNFHMISIRNQDYVHPYSHIIENPLDPLLPFLKIIFEYFWLMGPGSLLLLFAAGAWLGIKRFKKESLILLAWGMVPILIAAEFSKTMTSRYIYFSIPYIFILSSLAFYFVFRKKEKNFRLDLLLKRIVISAFLIFFIHSLFLDYQLITDPQNAKLPRSGRSGYFEEWTAGYGIKEVSEVLRFKYENDPDRKIVVGTEGYFGTLPDGLQIYLNDIPEITVIGVGQPVREVPQSLVESKEYGNETYLVVNDSRLLIDYKEKGLKLITSFDKAVRPDGTLEALLFLEIE